MPIGRFMRLVVQAMAMAIVAAGAVGAAGASGPKKLHGNNFYVNCGFSHTADDDPIDHYFDRAGTDNQPTGCRYESEDNPGGDLDDCQPGDRYDVEVSFRGEIQRNGSPIQTKYWTAIRNANWRP